MEWLGVSSQQIADWVDCGMPQRKDGRFNSGKVGRWLVNEGIGQPENEPEENGAGLVLTLLQEVAEYYGKSKRTVQHWCADPTFPGRAGSSSRHGVDGRFPIPEIDAWLSKKGMLGNQGDETAQRLREQVLRRATAAASREERKDLQEAGELVEIEVFLRELTRAHATAVAWVDQLPDEMERLIPPEVPSVVRRRMVRSMRQHIDKGKEYVSASIESTDASEEGS